MASTPPPPADCIQRNLVFLRYRLGLTQAALAERTGITRGRLASWEEGHALPPIPQAVVVCRLLGCTLDAFATTYVAA